MRNPITLSILAAVAVAATAFSTPALADKKADDLKKDGYKCERVSVNFWECTKDGGTTYWCDDAGNCQAKPSNVRGGAFRAPLVEGILEVNPGLGTNDPRGLGAPIGSRTAPLQLR